MKYNLAITLISSTLLNGCLGGNVPVGTYYTHTPSSYSSSYTPSYTSDYSSDYTPTYTSNHTSSSSTHRTNNSHQNSDYSNGRREGDYSSLIWNGSGEAYTQEGSRMRQYDK